MPLVRRVSSAHKLPTPILNVLAQEQEQQLLLRSSRRKREFFFFFFLRCRATQAGNLLFHSRVRLPADRRRSARAE